MAKKPTMHDVAAAAGVSQATVSLVLSSKSGSSRVSRDTADRVREAVRRLGYRTNAHAQMLREGRSRMIGLIGHEIATAPLRKCMSTVAGTPVIDSPNASATTSSEPRVTRTITERSAYSSMRASITPRTASASSASAFAP